MTLGSDARDYEIAWAAKLRWQERAEKAEATVARVQATTMLDGKPRFGAIPASVIRAALEGADDADPTRKP